MLVRIVLCFVRHGDYYNYCFNFYMEKLFWDVYLFIAAFESGMAASLSRDVIDNVLVDLNPVNNESSAVNPKDTQRDSSQHHNKRKRPSVPTSMKGQHERNEPEDITSSCSYTSVHLRIAALEALKTLLTSVGILYVIGLFG